MSDNGQAAEELFDYYDEQGVWLGTAPRSEVHAKGLWHRSIHCWLARVDGERKLLLFQQRSGGKDTFPGHYDVTAAGHLSAGETMQDAAREIEEELSLAIPFESLRRLGDASMEKRGVAKGVAFIDRETSDVFGYVYSGPLRALKLQAEEVSGLFEADLEAMIALFEGGVEAVRANGFLLDDDGQPIDAEAMVTAADFVPRPAAHYAEMFRALLRCL